MMRTARWLAGSTVLLVAMGLAQAAAVAGDLGVTAGSVRWTLLFTGWAALLAAAAGIWTVALVPQGERLIGQAVSAWSGLALSGKAAFVLAAGIGLLPVALVLAPLPEPLGGLLQGIWWRAAIFWLAALAGAALVSKTFPGAAWPVLFAGVCVVYGCLHQAAAFIPDVSSNPFSLGWSEASRYYYASLFFAERIYGMSIPPSVLHPSRYLMQAIPFLADGLPLWFHRLWQVGLWLACNALAAWLLIRRTAAGGRTSRLLLAAWAFLFLFQGPIWYHLVVIPAFLFWAVDPQDTRRTLLAVIAASAWAGVSRVNWIPFPAALAALLYLLEVPDHRKNLLRYLAPPLAWGLAGVVAGLAAQSAYVFLSGNPADQFGSSFTSDLLWYRLLPSATFPLGVLPGIILVTLPAAILAGWAVRRNELSISALRWLGIAAILAVFLAGGLVVSVKIGGGSNLHNMDGYLVLLLTLVACLAFRAPEFPSRVPAGLLIAAVLVPVGFALAAGGPLRAPDLAGLDEELAELIDLVEAETAAGGPVLFIAERQLLTFGSIDGLELVPDYEKVFLMEMAMAANRDYLDRFQAELEAHRFSLIVTDIVRYNPQTRSDQFGEENNAWDTYVSIPLLCSYREIQTFSISRVQVLVPRETPGDCALQENLP